MLKIPDKGEKRSLTIQLYDVELAVLEDLRTRYKCSRAAVLGALLMKHAKTDLTGKVPEAQRKGARSRRR